MGHDGTEIMVAIFVVVSDIVWVLQWLKKLSQCFTVLARSTWHKTSILHNILKIIYVILRHLGFLTNPGSCDLIKN